MATEEKDMEQLHEEIRRALLPEGGMVTKYIVIAETIDENGEQDLIMNESLGMQMWDREGLLHHALFSWAVEVEAEEFGDLDAEEDEDED